MPEADGVGQFDVYLAPTTLSLDALTASSWRFNHEGTAWNRSYEIVFTPPASNALSCVDGKLYDFSFTAKWADDGSAVSWPGGRSGGYLDPFVLYFGGCGSSLTATYTAESIRSSNGVLWERADPIEHCVAKPAAGEDLQQEQRTEWSCYENKNCFDGPNIRTLLLCSSN